MKKMLVLLAVVPFVNFAQTTFVEKEITGNIKKEIIINFIILFIINS